MCRGRLRAPQVLTRLHGESGRWAVGGAWLHQDTCSMETGAGKRVGNSTADFTVVGTGDLWL